MRPMSLVNCITFQSLVGRLGTLYNVCMSVKIDLFQSLVGRLGTRVALTQNSISARVSIPRR